jgi:hypothetical protein
VAGSEVVSTTDPVRSLAAGGDHSLKTRSSRDVSSSSPLKTMLPRVTGCCKLCSFRDIAHNQRRAVDRLHHDLLWLLFRQMQGDSLPNFDLGQ